jgi:hypothetical protein
LKKIVYIIHIGANKLNNLTLEEINKLFIDAGTTIQAHTAEFKQINASNEAQYAVTYGAGKKTNVYVYDLDGQLELSFQDFVDGLDEPAQPVVENSEEVNAVETARSPAIGD